MDSPVVQIRKYLHALYHRRCLFVLVAATTALLVVFSTFFMPKRYEAKSTVFIEENVVNSLMKGITVSPSMSDRIRVLRYHMLSRDIISRVLKKLDRDVLADTPEAFERLIQYCQETTQINLKGSDLFFVSFVDTSPEFARDYINTLVNTYVEENISAKREESFGAGRFLSEQVEFYKNKLNELEDKLYAYRKKTGIFSTVTEGSIVEEIRTAEEAIKELQVKKNELLATVQTIRDQLKAMKSLSASRGNTLADLMGGSGDGMRIDALQAQLDDLLLVYNDQYPAVVKLREQIAELQARLATEPSVAADNMASYTDFEDPVLVDLKMRLNSTQSQLNALQARETELQTQIDINKRILENFPEDKKVLAEMERERTMNRNVYETLLERVGVAEVSKQMEVADKATTFRIVDPAILPTFPVGTKRLLKMLAGLAVGLAAGVAAVFAREKLDDTVRDVDVLRAQGLTVLAEIPQMYSEQDQLRQHRRDRWLYGYAAVCFVGVALMLGHDLLGLSLMDQVIANLRAASMHG